MAQAYFNLVDLIHAHTGLAVIPKDLDQIYALLMASDARNKSIGYSLGVAIKPTKNKDTQPGELGPTTMKLVSYNSRGLNTNILNSQIGCKEVIAAVMAITYEEPILKLLINKPKYLLIDNAVLVGLLNQLEDSTLLANHFLAHPDYREWVQKLYMLVKKYKITVLLVSSAMQLADSLSRTSPDETTETVKEVKIKPKVDFTKCISHTSRSTECELCPGCHVFCQRRGNHSECKFNIKNKGEDHPRIPRYESSEPQTIRVEGKEIAFKTGSLKFNPADHTEVQVVKIIEGLGEFKPWNIEEMDSAEDHLLQGLRQQVEKDTIKEFTQKEIEAINNLTKEFGRSEVRRIGQGVWNKNTNPITKEGEFPPGFEQTFRDDQQISPKHTDTTIVLFASLTRSFKFNSIYNKGLKNTTVEQFYRKAGQVSRYVVNNQPYMVVTVPPNQPGETTVSGEQIFRLLAAIAQKLEEEDMNRHIIIDADLIWLYFNLEPKLALTAVTMAFSHAQSMFKSVEIQASIKLMKTLKKSQSCVLSKQLPVIINKQRTFNISIPLNDTGRAVNLQETIHQATNIEVTPANFAIEFNEGTARYHEDLNMCRANAIQIFRVRNHTRNINHRQRYATRYHIKDDGKD